MNTYGSLEKCLRQLNKTLFLENKKISHLERIHRVALISTILFFPALLATLSLSLWVDNNFTPIIIAIFGLIIFFIIALILGNKTQKILNVKKQDPPINYTWLKKFENIYNEEFKLFELFQENQKGNSLELEQIKEISEENMKQLHFLISHEKELNTFIKNLK